MIFHVYIKTNARQNRIAIKENNNLEIHICAPPIDGKANKYLVNYLSEIFKVPKSYINILKGLKSAHKTVEVIGNDEQITCTLRQQIH